jgi:hypothetical protein
METNTVMVFTGKSLNNFVDEGGSGDWTVRPNRIRNCRWLVAAKNQHADWSVGTEEHGTAFLIGQISGIRESDEPGRSVIRFDRYAEINIPEAWPGQRNPVMYTTIDKIGIHPDALEWKDMPKGNPQEPKAMDAAAVLRAAKATIAKALAIDSQQVEITIRY